MKISYNWLKEYIDIDISIDELSQKITDSGIEVEEIISRLPEFNNIVLGKVESKKSHPDADKLSICEVNDGTEIFQVICGAPNVQAGQLIPFARIGSILPNGLKIKKAKIRGVESSGMICSKEELGLEENSEGIWPLETNHQPGTDINIVLQDFNDYILDLFITSNRPDCLSHIGIAREIAAFTGKKVKWPSNELIENTSIKTADLIKIKIEDSDGCPRYAARIIKNVKIGPSPEWIVKKLEAIGLRSINNVVDVTNFVLNEVGQPLHAFDYNKITNNTIIVKKSVKGEKFFTLDDKERLLPENTVMICDDCRPVAIGGIMGGQNSEVSETTTDILLESAYFDPSRIIESVRGLSMMTDASQRFEKGTDFNIVIYALDRAAKLIQELAGGEISGGIIDEYPKEIKTEIISFNPDRVNRILGSDLSTQSIMDTLSKLDFNKTDNGISVPSYRVDIKEEIDLIEEVARLINLDNLPTSIFEPVYIDQAFDNKDFYINLLRNILVELGFQEIFTNSMLSSKIAATLESQNPVKIINPISDDLSVMRPALLPGILTTIQYNRNRNIDNLRIFEIGRIFRDQQNDIPLQPIHFAIALSGMRSPEFWNDKNSPVDFYDIKGLIESLCDKLNIRSLEFKEMSTDIHYFDKAMSSEVLINGSNAGFFGKISANFALQFDIDNEVFYADFNLSEVFKRISLEKKYKTIAKYPYIEKDLALIFENNVGAADVIKFINRQGGNLLKKVDIFDVYSGKNIGDGLKSIAFRLMFQSDERTLNDKEVDQVFRKIIKQTEIEFKATLRDK